MRRLGALLLILGTTMPAFAAEPPAAAADDIPWYRRFFLGERAKPAPKTTTAAKPPAAPPSRESVERTFQQEQVVYLQRLAAISKLKQVALARDDDAMMKKAAELEVAAQQIFDERTARLKTDTMAADRAALEQKPKDDKQPVTAQRPTNSRRPTPGGSNR